MSLYRREALDAARSIDFGLESASSATFRNKGLFSVSLSSVVLGTPSILESLLIIKGIMLTRVNFDA